MERGRVNVRIRKKTNQKAAKKWQSNERKETIA